MKKKLMLIDGNSIINRAFYGVPLLTSPSGEYTNALYGFLNIFFKLLEEECPSYIAVAFDVKEKTFRHKIFENYKGTRAPSPPELGPQIELTKALLKKMNIYTVELLGFEADDILGTLSLAGEKAALSVVIISGDKDMLQLASDTTLIRIPKTKGGKTVTENCCAKDFTEQTGVTPTQYIDVKALMGDTSDNIPGVTGIGEVTAFKIIREYGSLENAILNAQNIKPKKASHNLAEQADTARLSRMLAEIKRDAPIEADFSKMTVGDIYTKEARDEIIRLGLKSIAARFTEPISGATDNTPALARPDTAEAASPAALNTAVELVPPAVRNMPNNAPLQINEPQNGITAFCSFIINGVLKGLAVCTSASSCYINAKADDFIDKAKQYLTNEMPKVTLCSKTEILLYKKLGVDIQNIIFDSSIALYVLNPTKTSYACDDIAFDCLNESMQSLKEFEKAKETEQSVLEGFALKQASVLYRAYPSMKTLLTQNGLDYLYYSVELPLAALLAETEIIGVRVNGEFLVKFGEKLQAQIDELTTEIHNLAGEEFNINSPSQLAVILFDKLGLQCDKKTKTGRSTSAETLEKLVYAHPIIDKILEYRTLTKLNSTYVNGLIPLINPETGALHTSFNQTGTATGRLSSSNPNLQNIPVRLPLGRELRKALIAREGYIFMDADYSQIELRVLAHLSSDLRLIDSYLKNADIHALTASLVFNKPLELVTNRDRNAAKAVNFGVIYGISAYGLGRDTGLTNKDAKQYIESYFKTYPQVKVFLDSCVTSAREKGYAETMFGRRRPIPQINTNNFFERGFAERIAKNTPIQGTAADIIKIAMVNVNARLKKEGLSSRIVLQIHDELLLEVKLDEQTAAAEILKTEMEKAAQLTVPLVAEVKTGGSWYEAK